MSSFTPVSTTKAYKPLSQYSQAVKYYGSVHTAGTIGFVPETWAMVEGGVKEQTRQALLNIRAILEEAGSSMAHIYKANVSIMKMSDFAAMNEAWDEVFTSEAKPSRACVAVYQLPMGALVLIECSAALK
ncbi:endoribonuclease L-PSP [Microdochium trichocladiopsis]|uniref:Endoribonuclease L-PSP n=1 Tax=Microdochium trichocladiopsis TaxID=1682393 RepID=A0A9P8XS46_9PEZI|nr:endoribonuclease L-PSP [Microdochium trichocladiopsis]KAH7014246.1 endoribonuclease L-PSP [Microdochium trichocladiopsis]